MPQVFDLMEVLLTEMAVRLIKMEQVGQKFLESFFRTAHGLGIGTVGYHFGYQTPKSHCHRARDLDAWLTHEGQTQQ